MFEATYLSGRCLEFDSDTHTYAVDGSEVPSVTTLLQNRFPGKYAGVRPDVLRAAAERGTQIHAAIERFCRTGWEAYIPEMSGFKSLQEDYGFRVMGNEMPVIIFADGEAVAAGTTDLVLEMRGNKCGADIKTTSRIDKDYLEAQLNLYRIGFEQTYGVRWDKLYALHLRGTIKTMTEIPVNEELAREILENYMEGL